MYVYVELFILRGITTKRVTLQSLSCLSAQNFTDFLIKCSSVRKILLITKYVLSFSENLCMQVHIL